MSRLAPAPDALIGRRFDVAVAKMLGVSRTRAAEIVETGQARVLGRTMTKASTLLEGDVVDIDLVEEKDEPEDGGDAAANGTAETAQSGENVNNADEA